tara:strand:- start:9293 stop:9613 length:321 start_codon:yes stop_codon:yes gene_type:complete
MDAEPKRSSTTTPGQVYFRGAFVCFLFALVLVMIPGSWKPDVHPRWLDGALLTTTYGILILSLVGALACVARQCFRQALTSIVWGAFLFAIVMFWNLIWTPLGGGL